MIKLPSALYVHIPFCEKICHYCDFPKLQYFRRFAFAYLESLKEELIHYQPYGLKTIYVGGGTPTALEDDLFKQLLNLLAPFSNGVKEYTFEANPESLSEEKIKLMHQYGVNRLSIGVQTTDDRLLKKLNRQHTFNDVQKAVKLLKDYGFDNLNVDLILGLPHTSQRLLAKDLDNILSLGIQHISCYALSLHPHTVLYNRGYRELSEDQMRDYYDTVEAVLTKHHFIHYEVSNYCLSGYECIHNYTYWRNEQYYGVGLGAAGYLGNIRYKNTLNLNKYLKNLFIDEKEQLQQHDRLVYQIMLNLRTLEGLSLIKLKADFGVDLYQDKKATIDDFINRKYLVLEDENLKPTYEGMMILDTIILKLI